jgi:ABC-type nitrate/sulfonate/bicarbonate transport system ATPase subunit
VSFLEIDGVTRIFPGRTGHAPTLALQPVSVTLDRGEFVAILGPSGCGKSTLLRIVAGLDRPSGGAVRLEGRPVTHPGADRGMVFQSYTLFPWLTVEQNVRFGLREAGMAVAAQRRIADDLIRRVGLAGFARHWPRQLSGGMQQRCALARALAPDPAMLLLDEPFGALDHQTRELMQELLAGIWQADRKTVLFVTHDIDEAVFLATRVLVMSARPGRIKLDLPIPLPWPRPYTVKTSPDFTALKARLTEEIREEVRRAAEAG